MSDSQCMREYSSIRYHETKYYFFAIICFFGLVLMCLIFSDTINTLSKLGKQGAISITPSTMSFIIFDDGTPRRPLAQCVFEQKYFFSEFTVVGVSDQHSQICLQFTPGTIACSLFWLNIFCIFDC